MPSPVPTPPGPAQPDFFIENGLLVFTAASQLNRLAEVQSPDAHHFESLRAAENGIDGRYRTRTYDPQLVELVL